MIKSRTAFKNSKSLKGRLRRVKNDLNDQINSTRHQIDSTKDRLLNSQLIKRLEKPEIVLTESQIKEKYNEILDKNEFQVDLCPFEDNSPLVSIIILNRNGSNHLKRLFGNFKENIRYPNYELIIVDNASTDDSMSFLKQLSDVLPLKIIKNNENKSFSQSNNKAARIAKGEYILLLNNDVEPLYGWLNEMMQTALKYDDIGAVGAKLIYPDCSNSRHNKNNSFKIQHRGIAFKEEEGFIKPYNLGDIEPFSAVSNLEKERAAVTAAALLVKKDKYWQVGGLDEGYNYGYEDVDLCLKLLKMGYKNIYCPKALLFHYEFGTQERNKNKEVKNRRLKNSELFSQKWNRWLYKQLFMDKLKSTGLFSEKPLKVAFAVTECGENASAGDYFTAVELGEGLKKLGWEIIFLSRKGPENWYDIGEDVDVLISMLDVYNPQKIKSSSKSLIKVAWLRNWFNRWISSPGFADYDIIFASSKTACNHIKDKSGREALLLPIATNSTRFNDNISQNEEYLSDYCFTGSYWNDHREIIEMLDPESMPYEFKLYGKNWDKIDKFKNYNQGFINYSNLPEVYASTKIVIDDANRVTKKYGAVNSRVYDALASGALILTNGEIGAERTFRGKLPVFKCKGELNALLKYYLVNHNARTAKVKELQEFVLKNHTYENRANTLKEVLEQHTLKTKISIKISAPKWKEVHEWGDYHLALGLKKEFERKNCDVIIQILPEWDNGDDINCDVVIVLRGLSKYNPKSHHHNIMWNISHPDKVNIEEYNQYDYVLIASKLAADKIRKTVNVPADAMLQCTDPELFYPEQNDEYKHDLLFVGNSRKSFRKIIKDLLPTDKDLGIYGMNWKRFVSRKYIKGKHIPNNQLRKAYSSCKILLNDHWDDMKEKGFISNRLFDGFAAGAFIISDNVKGAAEVFGDSLVTYSNADELHELMDYYLDHDRERIKKAEKGRETVLANYTFAKRVERILEIVNGGIRLNNQKLPCQSNQTKVELKSSNLTETNELAEKDLLADVIEKKDKEIAELSPQINYSATDFYEIEYNGGRPIIQRLISKFPTLYILFNRNNHGIKNAITNIKGYKTIKKNNMLDINHYLKNSEDVRQSGVDPILHYLYHGYKEGRNPSFQFDTDYYIQTHKDLKESNLNPLVHYSLYGIYEGRKTNGKFNSNISSNNNFARFLADSLVSPVIHAPFREEDKRCFAMMENVARYLMGLSCEADDTTLVSVIMPVYNRIDIVKSAIDSVLEQTYRNIELVIVDDGSDDGTAELLENIGDERIVLLRNETCQGVSSARNRALAAASGKYIAYLDSDNIWDPRYIAAIVGAFLELPDAEAVYSGQLLFDGKQEQPFAVRFGSFNKSLLANRNYIDLNAFCHTHDVYMRLGGFDEGLWRCVDWDLIIRVAETSKMYSIPVLLSYYYYDKAQNTITGDTRFIHQEDIVQEKRKKRMQNNENQVTLRPPEMNNKVSIIIPSYESLEDLQECINAILMLQESKWVEIIVVDNNSSQSVVNYLVELASGGEIKLIRNDINYGFTYAVNQGIAASKQDNDIIILNNDAIITPGAVKVMQKAAYELPQCGMIVPQQVLPGGTKTITTHVPYAKSRRDCDVNLSAHHANILNVPLFHSGESLELSFAPFFCVYIKRDVLDRSVGLDAEFGRHYRSDHIFCSYVRHVMNLKIYHVSEAVVYHKLQKSTDVLREKSDKNDNFNIIFRKNQWDAELAAQLGYKNAIWDI